MAVTLTPHQQAACDWMVEQLSADVSPVALTGLAGTGKTSIIPALVAALQARNIPVTIGAPTHRAAMILRRKGLDGAGTVHAHALTPYFLAPYAQAYNVVAPIIDSRTGYPVSHCPTRGLLQDAGKGIPPLLQEGLAKYQRTLSWVQQIAARYGAKRALETLGIHGRDYFDGFGPRIGEGVLLIDEASMVGTSLLALCQEAFPLIGLIGDPGQLPPVKDLPALAGVPTFQLTEIHRQAQDSPIRALAYAAREGTANFHQLARHPGHLDELLGEEAQRFLTAPLIVWRNTVRLNCTKSIRAALGYPAAHAVAGEPLVCRSSNPEDRALGLYNNGLYRVLELLGDEEDGAALIQPLDDPEAETIRVFLHLEELSGEAIPAKATPFRFGYCLTAHTAQGGEWPTVYIAKQDLYAYLGTAAKNPDPARRDEARQWAYTAITRAKDRLVFLSAYDFTTMKEKPMPKLTVDSEASDERPLVLDPPPDDDILDPPTPPAVRAALNAGAGSIDPSTPAGQAALTIDEVLYKFTQHSATVLTRFGDDARGVLRGIDGAWAAILSRLDTDNRALTCLKEALQTYTPCTPYSATVQSITPSGRPVSFTVQHATWDGFMAQMSHVLGVVNGEGWTAPPMAPAAKEEGVPF